MSLTLRPVGMQDVAVTVHRELVGFPFLLFHDERRRGHATHILRRSLDLLAADGVERALIVCNDDNVASAAVIERCGGVYERPTVVDGVPARRYRIDLGSRIS